MVSGLRRSSESNIAGRRVSQLPYRVTALAEALGTAAFLQRQAIFKELSIAEDDGFVGTRGGEK